MYNEERKRQYLEEVTSRNLTVAPFFARKFEQLEKFEVKNGVDAAEFNVSEIFEFYKSLCTTSYNTLLVTNSQLSYYCEWCREHNLVKDSQNHYLEITNDMMHMCINKGLADAKIITREEVLTLIKDLPNVSDQFLILALFEGLGGKDNTNFCGMKLKKDADKAVESNISVIDPDKEIAILKDGRQLKISHKLVELAIESADTYVVSTISDGEEKIIHNMRYDEYDSEIIKVVSNSKSKPDAVDNTRRFYVRLMRAREVLGGCPAINKYPLIESGRIGQIKKYMEEQGITDPAVCIARNRKELERVWGRIQSVPQYVNRYFDI